MRTPFQSLIRVDAHQVQHFADARCLFLFGADPGDFQGGGHDIANPLARVK